MSSDGETCRINITNGLLLYYHHYSYYSQKVIMALHEKNLKYEGAVVDIIKGQQYDPWFLAINPRGEVPVLQDIAKIIPDSTRIIDYLEDNFSNGDTPRLIPNDQGDEIKQKVIKFRNMIDQIPSGIVTMGSFFHTEFVQTPKAPFYAPVRKLLANAEKGSSKKLREYAEKNPSCRDILLQKAESQEKKHLNVIERDQFYKILDNIDRVLSSVETELSSHDEEKSNWWLCSDRFTVADISLTILLERLNQLGLESHFWSLGKKPFLCTYYDRVQQRSSYKKAIPNTCVHIKTFVMSQNPVHLAVGTTATIAILIGGIVLIKKMFS
ncbi:ganglioside-induced differentiation-associated protein 1 [Onthophagus taurus]|uniref:ganglioside-induced differentiation-associated protein 1 n=1 Tax=Onthophagus taurus TaxID=166361 RepID=UPI000C20CC00|nr:ganglioside-induced differentiation-associated protein 1 [Onthophagus taurus]